MFLVDDFHLTLNIATFGLIMIGHFEQNDDGHQ